MTVENKIIEIAGDVGKHEIRISELSEDCTELKKRPNLPGWICRWAGQLSIALIFSIVASSAINFYRLGEVEKSLTKVSDRLQIVEIRLASLTNVTDTKQNLVSLCEPDMTQTVAFICK